ncbi:MAG: STY4851/ECs_5259 family protein [Candidatus Contendobacter sp.]
MNSKEWRDGFLRERGLSAPDERPLYAYRCSDGEYEIARKRVCNLIRNRELFRREDPILPILFCLFAAEAWRRHHEAGPWKWQTVLREVDAAGIEHSTLVGWVERGLRYWRRKLIVNSSGREFLLTIACEGGLPLNLLRREGSGLRRYFRALLEELPRYDKVSVELGRELAERLRDRLPSGLRQEVVYQLSGKLITTIWDLQAQVVGNSDPIGALNRLKPDWRDDLPLSLGDTVTEVLLRNLVEDAAELRRQPPTLLRWQCSLERESNGGWQLTRRLALPGSCSGEQLADWTGLEPDQMPNRFRLLHEGREGLAPIALITHIRGAGAGAIYRIEQLGRALCFQGLTAMAAQRLQLTAQQAYSVDAIGNEPLSDYLPWVFSEKDANLCPFLGEGSLRIRASSLLVAAPSDHQVINLGQGAVESLGSLAGVNRALYRLQGAADVVSPDGEHCRLSSAVSDEQIEMLRLTGPIFPQALNERPVFRGMPWLEKRPLNGNLERVNALEWRPADRGDAGWRPMTAACVGNVWVRWVEDGILRFRARAEIIPASANAMITTGRVTLTGLLGARVRIGPLASASAAVTPTPEGVVLDCKVTQGTGPERFNIVLDWLDGRTLDLELPFPVQGALFAQGGMGLPPGAVIPLGRLGAARAVAQAPDGGGGFRLEGELRAEDIDQELQRLLWLNEPLRLVGNGRCELELHTLQDAITRLFSATASLDAQVRLSIVGQGSQRLATITVARFDLFLTRDCERGCVQLGGQPEPNCTERLTMMMLPLWEPEREPVILVRRDDETAWSVPPNLETGPWLVLGRDGGWLRTRPLLWTVTTSSPPDSDLTEVVTESGADDSVATHGLIETIRSPEGARGERFKALLAAMAERPQHPDWPRLLRILDLTQELPATSLDLCRCLGQTPAAAIMALLLADGSEFERIWSLAEQLPFDWRLTPVALWLKMTRLRFDNLRTALEGTGLGEKFVHEQFDVFRQRLATRGESWETLGEWLQKDLFPNLPVTCRSMLNLAKAAPTTLEYTLGAAQQDLFRGHIDEQWPILLYILEQAETKLPTYWRFGREETFHRPVLCAPFLVATLALRNWSHAPALLFELHRARDFDPPWFDTAYATALCLGLAGLTTNS